jgi:hypothetical protein
MPTPSISLPPYRIFIRDAGMIQRGEMSRLSSLKLIPRFNDVGAFEVVIPFADPKAPLLVKGGWLEFTSNDNAIMAGQIRGYKLTQDDSNPGGTLTVYGPSAEQVLADRLAYQVPGSAATSQGADDYDNRNAAGETVIKGYVNANAGPGALAARRTTNFVIATDTGLGTTVKGSARMTNLLELCAELATASGLGFRVVFNAVGQLEFRVFVPTDKSGSAKFGTSLGNLVSFESTQEAAKTNCAIIGGGGDGTARTFREINDTAAQTLWSNRSETFIDRRDSTDTVELDQAGTEEIVNNGPVNGLSIKTADTPNLQFYRDYFLGDKVSIPQAGITDVLREVEINWSAADGPSTESTVGTAATTGTLKMLDQLAALNAKVAALEAKK